MFTASREHAYTLDVLLSDQEGIKKKKSNSLTSLRGGIKLLNKFEKIIVIAMVAWGVNRKVVTLLINQREKSRGDDH